MFAACRVIPNLRRTPMVFLRCLEVSLSAFEDSQCLLGIGEIRIERDRSRQVAARRFEIAPASLQHPKRRSAVGVVVRPELAMPTRGHGPNQGHLDDEH